MDIWAVSTVWLLLITLLQTLGCVSHLESTKRLLYPWGKYLALQFWNRRVALCLTSFFNFFYDSHRERGRDTGRGRSRLHAPGAQSGIRSRVSRITHWAKGRCHTASPPRDPLFLTSRGPSRLFSTVAAPLFMYSCETQRGRVIGRGKMRLYAGSQMWDVIPQTPGS